MTSLPGRPNDALLVIDLQNGVVENAHDRDGVIARIQSVVAIARVADVPVVWIQHESDELPPNSPRWEYVPELVRDGADPLVHKTYGDAFEDTELESC